MRDVCVVICAYIAMWFPHARFAIVSVGVGRSVCVRFVLAVDVFVNSVNVSSQRSPCKSGKSI